MSIEVYWGSGSTPAWRVLLAFAYKGVPYSSKLLSFSNKETRTPEFLALNPRGKVPTIREGDFVLNESLAILAWLDKRFAQPPLFGEHAEETGQIWRHVMEFESLANATIGAVARPILFGNLENDAAKVKEALPALVAELDLLEKKVAGGYLVGKQLSTADIVWFCGLQQLVRAATRPAAAGLELGLLPIGNRWPNIARWAGNVEAIPGYEATMPPHWLEGDHPSPKSLRG